MKHLPLLALTILVITVLVGCSDNSTTLPVEKSRDTGQESIDLEVLRADLAELDLDDLSAEEVAGLLFMREEEKLARDVYLTFDAQYDKKIFGNIAVSEQNHTDAILALLEAFGIDDPVKDNPRGVFENEELQTLYDELIAEGAASLASALYVGCAIEEIDMLDIVEYMEGTENEAILLVYGRLLDGSANHLRAYVRTWENETGLVYVPRFMSVEYFTEIMAEDGPGSGRQGGRGNRN